MRSHLGLRLSQASQVIFKKRREETEEGELTRWKVVSTIYLPRIEGVMGEVIEAVKTKPQHRRWP
ncbi:MAG: hypothetical protein M0Z77_05670 [Thermoplasmatales archaeon]|nr:hypothetical protein [Thermoplasmatales archaeon]